MNYDDTMRSAFLDELTKIAAAQPAAGSMPLGQSPTRIGTPGTALLHAQAPSPDIGAALAAGAPTLAGTIIGNAIGRAMRARRRDKTVASKQSALLDERTKTAEAAQNPPAPLTIKQKVLAGLLGGPAGYFGAVKGAPHGEALEGAARGFGGATLGGMAGSMAGSSLGALAQKALPSSVPAGLVPALGQTAGSIVGNIAGYKALTRKYNTPPTEA